MVKCFTLVTTKAVKYNTNNFGLNLFYFLSNYLVFYYTSFKNVLIHRFEIYVYESIGILFVHLNKLKTLLIKDKKDRFFIQ